METAFKVLMLVAAGSERGDGARVVEIADALHCSRSTVYRNLAKLKDFGMVHTPSPGRHWLRFDSAFVTAMWGAFDAHARRQQRMVI